MNIQNLYAAFPPEQYLPDMARACSLASVHAGGLVEPLYRLHTTRLKILQQPQFLEPAALALIARCAGLLEFVHAGGAIEHLFGCMLPASNSCTTQRPPLALVSRCAGLLLVHCSEVVILG